MGTQVLNFTASGTGAPDATAHVWCTGPAAGAAAGAVTVAYVNANAEAAALSVPTLPSLTPRVEYFLTATASGLFQSHNGKPLPKELWADEVYLNGALMSVDANGVLPAFPIPGHNVPSGSATPLSLPGLSYGFIVFPDARAQACM